MKKIVPVIVLIIFSFAKANARQTANADSFKVLKYHINLNITDFAGKTIKGYTDVHVQATKNGLNKVNLDLLKLQVKSVAFNKALLGYTYNDTLLSIRLNTPANLNDTFTLRIEYEGKPQSDKTWGGFYFSGNYAFNMGVGFSASPHPFGRVWFPCLDTFTSRSLYKFSITVPYNYRAMCNGIFTAHTTYPDSSHTMTWETSYPIPTYLASVAVAPYGVHADTFKSVNGDIPITLAALPADTAKMLASFIHLNNAIAAYEKWYGPHRFERVGYNAVPFSSGAMEHPGNIAYPLATLDGTTSNETTMAHELSHHWWGNNTTCRTGEDMWLNEGWASFSEYLFLEEVYGKKRYNQDLLANNYEVLRWAHLQDGRAWAMNKVPHAYTYGRHVYAKGAEMVHTLRSYMGDAAFMAGCKDFQEKKKYSDVSSDELKNSLQAHTTANLTAFFNNWIYEAGFPAFSAYILGTSFVQGKYNCTVKVHQQLRFTNKTYTSVPLKLHFINAQGGEEIRDILINHRDTSLVVSLPINPVMVVADRNQLLSDAVTDEEKWVKDSSSFGFNYALADGKIGKKNTPDSVLLRIEHHWTAPADGPNPYPGLYTSGYRYWKVDGTWSDTLLDATCYFEYAGNKNGNFSSGWLDNDLIKITEDSLRLLYRKNPSSPWEIYPHCTQNFGGNKQDKVGLFSLQKLRKGEYVFAMYDKTLGIKNDLQQKGQGKLDLYPNPTNGIVKIEFDDVYRQNELIITDNLGKTTQITTLFPGQSFVEIDTAQWSKGIYYVSLGGTESKKLVVE